MPGRLTRAIAVIAALVVVVGTGVAWGKIRTFESGINHISSAALGGGGEDGAIDILLVGLDSRTDAHGNPLSADELAMLRAGDDVSTNTDTIILVRIPNNGKSATAISIPRDSYVPIPGHGSNKINAALASNREIATNVIGSVALTPNSRPFITCRSPNEASKPSVTPIMARVIPCLITRFNVSRVCAPKAMRMPISRVRCVTTYAITL